jgi:hypothetical protein
VYLRDKDGKIVRDARTGTARRLDHVVIKDGKVLAIRETTSLTATKTSQSLKETRIRESGGVYIRDRKTGSLIDVSKVKTQVDRLK